MDIRIRSGSDLFVGAEDTSRCGAQILLEWLLVCHGLDRLVRHLNSNPYFDGATELAELFMEVLTTVQLSSTECLIEIWHRVR